MSAFERYYCINLLAFIYQDLTEIEFCSFGRKLVPKDDAVNIIVILYSMEVDMMFSASHLTAAI